MEGKIYRDVAFSCNEQGTRFLNVAVWSLLEHYRGEVPLRVNVFEGWGGHSERSKAQLRAIVESHRATLRYHNVEKYVAPYADLLLNREKSRWNIFTWTPVFTPQVLDDAVGAVIHFDIDMLFNADISPLFEVFDVRKAQLSRGMPSDALIACCEEYDVYGDNAGRVVWEKGILPRSCERYFNTGVLVMDAAACRTERTWEKIVEWYRRNYAIADRIEQDAWNALYADRCVPLHVKWNFHDRNLKNYAKWPLEAKYWLGNPPRECLEAALEPAILHFWGPKKPWKPSHRPYRRLYHAAMRAVGQVPPREQLLAPYYDFVNRMNLRKIRRHLASIQTSRS